MVNWANYGHTIIGTASNGELAYKMINDYKPDIVITDIKMPVMTGLELIQKCYEEKRELPVFILLTSYEEIQFYKEAIKYQVLEYLVKLELTPEALIEAVSRAEEKVNSLKKTSSDILPTDNIDVMKERFLIRMILNMFYESDNLSDLINYYNLDFSASNHVASYFHIFNTKEDPQSDKQFALYTSSLQMIRELLAKYIPCEILSLDIKHFCVIFHLDDSIEDIWNTINDALKHVSDMLFSYYSVKIIGGVGSPVSNPLRLCDSYQDAKRIAPKAFAENTIYYYPCINDTQIEGTVFNMTLFRDDLQKAFTEYDGKALYSVFNSLMELFENSPSHYIQAIDAAGSILYMALSFLHNGDQVVSDIFADTNAGYRSLYESISTADVLKWMEHFRDGLCDYFNDHNKDFKGIVVTNVKKYIRENNDKRLSLNEVAQLFNISPSYLSLLFSKYNDVGFSDYINQCKIDTAKNMLKEGELKIYEIADELGFESTSYFSRVFKKVTGLSPRDYLNQLS